MKIFNLLLASTLLLTFLASCNLPGNANMQTQAAGTSLTSSSFAATSTQIQIAVATQTPSVPIATATSIPTLIPPDTPVWSVYTYTCELAVGGGTMTMNLAWTDRSSGEESYKVYRDDQVIATLSPNSTSYVDIAFVATGKTVSYSVEAFNENWQTSTSTITHGCQ